jgi:hypothetical protein
MGFVQGFCKIAWDSGDLDERHVWIAANRSITGDGWVHDTLLRAAKDPHLEVIIDGPDVYASSKDRADFAKSMKQVRSAIGPKPKKLSRDRMDWHREYAWLIQADKNNPKFKPRPEKESDESHHSRLSDYLASKKYTI